MIFKYGTFALADGEARPLSFRTEGKRGTRAVLEQVTTFLDIEIEIIRDGQVALTNYWKTIDAGLRKDGADAGFYHSPSQGGAESAIFLRNSTSISGVYLNQFPSLNEMAEGDYSNSLKGRAGFAAVYLASTALPGGGGGGGEQLTQYSEGFSFNGTGGPRIVWTENDREKAEKYVLTNFTICSCQQTGSLRSLSPNPEPNPPKFPDYEIGESRQISPVVEVQSGTGDVQYSRSWSYFFQNSEPFSGMPLVR